MNNGTAELSTTSRLYEVVERQAGYFTAAQAKEAGLSQPLLTYHVRSGRFVRVRWGIYRLVHCPASPHEDLFIAWLEAGPDAVISHHSALALYDLSDTLPGRIHLTVPRTSSRRRSGLAVHTNRLDAEETTTVEGLPVTTVSRTIADVASGGLAEEQVMQAAQQAIERGLVREDALRDYAQGRGGRPQRLIDRALGERTEASGCCGSRNRQGK
jgi:predicted transcriptional regulator of viral defense system